MIQQQQQLRYFLYARKSSESEDRQMASIDDQIKEVEKIAKELGLNIVAVFKESKSAKAPGRKVFNEMLLQIEKGKADGIVCWKLNRLARNPVDGGKISWMLQQNIIQHIQCYGRDYKPSDNVLMMQVELGMANQFVKDLSVDVKRGVRAKAERGWNPSSTLPIGYMHNKDEKGKILPIEITVNKEPYIILKKLWKYLLTNKCSIADIKRKGDELGLVNSNKRHYSKANYHRTFSNKFYCGYFSWKDDKGILIQHKGKHRAMITEEEFDEVQHTLGNRQHTRLKKYNYPYRGLLRCGECGCGITAERKHQVRCTKCNIKFSCMHRNDCPECKTKIETMIKPKVIDIIYYRCSKSKQKCSQKFITQEDLEKQFLTILEGIEIQQEFYNFLCEELEILHQKLDKKENEMIFILKKRISELKNRLKSLTLMRADAEIGREEYDTSKTETNKQIYNLGKELKKSDYRETYWLKIAKDYLNISLNASNILKNKDNFIKKKILSKIASNQILLDKKLYFIRVKPLLAIQSCYRYHTAKKTTFEPEKNLIKQGCLQDFDTQSVVWRTQLNLIRTSIISDTNNKNYLQAA